MGSFRKIWDFKNYITLSRCNGVGAESNVPTPKRKALLRRKEKVYDIVNCGPRNRFVVRGKDGQPFIVHNCVQHLARCALTDMMLKIKRLTGMCPKLSVHDELVYIVDENLANDMLAHIQNVMRGGVEWWPELVCWSEGSYGDSYGEAK